MTGVSRSLLLSAALVVLAVAGCASKAEQRPAAAQRTSAAPASGAVVKTFSPYAATGTLGVPVADQTAGTCWTGSIAVPKAGVYRCLVDNAIYDPCFAPPSAGTPGTVACMEDPWSATHLVTLTESLPQVAAKGGPDNPWALELANSAHCVAATGTVPVVSAVPLNYVCGDGMAAGLVVKDVERMKVEYGSSLGGTLTAVDVKVAWRG
jgi:hypothetical protein